MAPPIESKTVKEGHWIWLGSQLAKKIRAKVGDTVELLIAGKTNEVAPFTVTAITKFGLYDHDLHYARIDLNVFIWAFFFTIARTLAAPVKRGTPGLNFGGVDFSHVFYFYILRD